MNPITTHEHRLTLPEVLEWMVADGLVGKEEAESLKVERRMHGVKDHPLKVIADQKWIAPGTPVRLLTLEALTEWLAGKVGLDYLHIDPLKIDFTGVTDVMSSAYAGALQHPAGAGDDARDRHRHRRAVRPRVGRGTEADPAQGHPPRPRQSRRHLALPGRVLQPRQVGQEGGGAAAR